MVAFSFLACGLLIFGAISLPKPGCASGVALKRAHPLFGKCTPSDRLVGTKPGISFLQDGSSSPSDAECMQLLAESDVLTSMALKLSGEDSAGDGIASSNSAEELVSHAVALLNEDAAAEFAHSQGTLRKIWNHLKDSARESSLIVLGVGPELFAFSKISKNVIAVEHDNATCEKFMESQAGACAMQANVHIYCTRPASSQKFLANGTSIVEMINSATDTSEPELAAPSSALELVSAGGTEKLLTATNLLIEDLVAQQFGDLPISSLVILGPYPVAKLMVMQQFLDQSTVIVVRSRMTADGLIALRDLMRVLIYYEDGHRTDPHSTSSVFLLQRLFTPVGSEPSYLQFLTPAWEFSDDVELLQLVDTVRQELLSGSFASGVSEQKRAALDTYLSVYALAARRGTDEQWKVIKASLQALRTSVAERKTFDAVLNTARNFAVRTAKACASETGLQEYLKLLEETLERKVKDDVQIQAVMYAFVADAINLVASPNSLEKLKDSIENACELADSKPKLLLPALRLIRAGMVGREYLSQVHKILEGLVKLGPEADVSALSSGAAQLEA
ncbi:hypothetical protein Efla_005784 [Eimeria flavescens]